MKNLSQKQKIAITVILISVITILCYYMYSKEGTEVIIEENTNENIVKKETKSEQEVSKEKVIIHIAGAVNKEGILELEKGKRISDAIEMAGGLKENAELKNINLAYVLEDGEKIYIPIINEEIDISMQKQQNTIEKSTELNVNKKININTADKNELETITGIGEATAAKIIEYRKENGKFSSIEELKKVSGIGEKKFEKLKNEITI